MSSSQLLAFTIVSGGVPPNIGLTKSWKTVRRARTHTNNFNNETFTVPLLGNSRDGFDACLSSNLFLYVCERFCVKYIRHVASRVCGRINV